jgi:molybdopterin-guanine dinucleotide biosynthesis protein A
MTLSAARSQRDLRLGPYPAEIIRQHEALRETTTRETLPLPITGAVLCGGRSSRMGRPKAFLPYDGRTIIERRFTQMRELFAEVVLVANDPDAYSHFSVDVVKDIIPNRGPLVGILSALLVSQFEHTFVIACDMPLVDNKLMRAMAQQRHGTDVLVLSHDEGVEPLLGVYSKRCVQPLEESIFAGALKAMDFLNGINAKLFKYEDRPSPGTLPAYFNVNTPQDYSRLLTTGI